MLTLFCPESIIHIIHSPHILFSLSIVSNIMYIDNMRVSDIVEDFMNGLAKIEG